MEELAGQARLREYCNETIKCTGNFVICYYREYCRCTDGYAPNPSDPNSCSEIVTKETEEIGADPTMIGVVVGLALMSVTICIVMRLFAKARFTENRTIFNTPNPRLMNASLKSGRGKAANIPGIERGLGRTGNIPPGPVSVDCDADSNSKNDGGTESENLGSSQI